MEHTLNTIGAIIGGGVGNTIEAGCDGYNTYEDVEHHDYSGAVVSGVETVYHGVEAVTDFMSGDIVF